MSIKRKKKICKLCLKEKYLFSKGRCQKCTALDNINNKSNEVDTINKHKVCKVSKSPKFPLNDNLNIKEKDTSQYDMFLEIWNQREHISEISGKALVGPEHKMFIWQFEHILGKGAYPKFKLYKKNIILMTWQEHFDITNNSIDKLDKDLYINYFKLKEELIKEYYN